MNKIKLGILVVAIVAVFIVSATAQVPNEVYLVPQDSNAAYCNTVDVEMWVHAIELGGGQINLTYNSTCANVTNWVRNTTNFAEGRREHYAGREWLTFSTCKPQPTNLTGKYMIGIVTIHCVNISQGGCEIPLTFIAPSTLFNDTGFSVTATWINGTFTCSSIPAQSYVVSSDASGKEKNRFNPNTDDVFCYAGNLPPNTTVDIYVVANKTDWVVGAPLEDISGIVENETTNVSGGIWPPVKIWALPLDVGQYDIVIDVNRSGTWDAGEPIDSWTTTGFDVIPEFSTIAIPVAAVIGLFLLMRRRRN